MKRIILDKRLQSSIATYILAIITLIILFFPVYWMILTSLQNKSMTYAYPPRLIPLSLRFSNYISALTGKPIIRWLSNTLIVSISTTMLCVLVSAFAAYSISRFRYRGRLILGMFILASQMFPATLFIVPYYTAMQKIGLINTLYGLAMTYTSFSIPLCVWMMKGFFDSIPREIEDAAEIDGCDKVQVLFHIVLPVSLAGIVATALFAFITAWQEFMFARTLITTMDKWTGSVGVASLRGEYEAYWNDIMAAAVVFALPVVIVVMSLERYLVSGLTGGAVKG